jgi:ABC-type glutathione transport system ATPase component
MSFSVALAANDGVPLKVGRPNVTSLPPKGDGPYAEPPTSGITRPVEERREGTAATLADQPGAVTTDGAPVVRAEQIHKSFGDNVVLDGIDLEVTTGETLVVIGPSGSGKSTLLRTINLLEPIQSGRIFFEGEEITKRGVKVDQVRQRIGIVFQQFNLFPHLRVMDNLTLGARRVKKIPRREAEERARGLLGRVGLPEKARAYPHQRSPEGARGLRPVA